MAWVSVELTYGCPRCGDIKYTHESVCIYSISRDMIINCRAHELCDVCPDIAPSTYMKLINAVVPVKDNFGASIF